MGFQCCGSVANLVLGVGLGVIALTGFAAAVMFFEFYDGVRHEGKEAFDFGPNDYYYEMKVTSFAAALLSVIAGVVALGAISISGCCEGKTGILVGIGGGACAFAFGGIVAEGVFFGYVVSQNTKEHLDSPYRNVSSAQKYILNFYKEVYETAVDSLKKKDENLTPDSWDTVDGRIGHGYSYTVLGETHTKTFTWKCLFDPSCKAGIDDLKNVIVFSKANGFLTASLGVQSVKVASGWFNISVKNVKQNRYYTCWNTSDNSALKCKYLERESEYTFPEKEDFSSEFDITQNIFKNMKGNVKIPYYNTIEQAEKVDYQLDYTANAFAAYRILKWDDIKDKSDDDLVYEKADGYYRINPETYLKYKYQQSYNEMQGKTANKLDMIYLCRSEPNDLKSETLAEKDCHQIEGFDYSDVKAVLPYQFRQSNVASYPSFFLSYKAYQSKDAIFTYGDVNKLAQFSVGIFVTQIFAIICYGIGKALANKFKAD
jgi:hypothetical protein